MKTVEINYNPYKMITKMSIDDIDVCENSRYTEFKKFIDQRTPLQTWIEPIKHLDWNGFVNEISDPSINDEVTLVFSGRVIDFRDLKHAIKNQNDKREKRTRVKYHYVHKKILDDKELSKNIEYVVKELKSERFAELVSARTTAGLTQKYNELDNNYSIAKGSEFHIVLAGVYSSGKSTLLNTLIRHDILPTSDNTCTSKNCRIKHDGTLKNNISLTCYDIDGNVVVDKIVFDDDAACATTFQEICPTNGVNEKYAQVATMELGANLSHLYPKSVTEDKFTIVLIDTPGMDSAQSSIDGVNRHAEIALNAITDESKPMIILCAEATKYEDDSIGEFMRDVVSNSKDDGGFNDRYLFLMNKSDSISYRASESAEKAKITFAEYLTDSTKWNIKGDEDELRELAANAEKFVPRVFMTAALMAWGIQERADQYSRDVLKADSFKRDLKNKLNNFVENISIYEDENLYLSQYCDIPDYRKEEIYNEFKDALENGDDIRAAELQCGIISVEIAIKDYIERYAFPVKVRDLLETFEDILIDVKSFAQGILSDMLITEKELGEKSSEREEAKSKKTSAEEKIAALNKAKETIKKQDSGLDSIQFDSSELGKATSEFQAEIERDNGMKFIRENQTIMTGQRSRNEVEAEIESRIKDIENLFDITLKKTNDKLLEIKEKHDKQIVEIFDYLKSAVDDLEEAGVFETGEYKFTDSVFWKLEFKNLDSSEFLKKMKNSVVDTKKYKERVENDKKWEWRYGDNKLKKFASFFMPKTKLEKKYCDGYYDITYLKSSIDEYFINLDQKSSEMEQEFEEILNNSKKRVRDLIAKLTDELENYHSDIAEQSNRIATLSESIDMLNEEISKYRNLLDWLDSLELKIKGE